MGLGLALLIGLTLAAGGGCGTTLVISAHDGGVGSVAFSPDGALLASAGEDGTARVFRVADGEELHVLQGHEGVVSRVDVSSRGNVIATSGDDGTVRLWTVAGGHSLRVVPVGRGDLPASVTFSPDGSEILVGNAAGAVRSYLVSSGRCTRTLPRAPDDVGGGIVTVLHGAEHIAVVDLASIEVRSAADGSVRHRIETGVVHAAAFSPTGELLAGLEDGSARLYRVADGRPTATLAGHEGPVRGVAVARDGGLCATAGDDEAVRLWRLAFWVEGEDRLHGVLRGHDGAVLSVAFSPRGDLIATGGADGTVRVWRVPQRGEDR